jgi:hypothetical protein
MSILGTIFSKIFPSSHAANAPAPAAPAAPADGSVTTPSAPAVAPVSTVDVEKMLDELNGKSAVKLNWRTSIVDLMKLLGIESSLDARKQLAQELHYTGDMNDSASMNIWLHKEVMKKVAANGGTVPSDLKD